MSLLRIAFQALAVATALVLSASPATAQDDTALAATIADFERDCQDGRGSQNACIDYGYYLFEGVSIAKDEATALRLWRPACEKEGDHNVGLACFNLSVLLGTAESLPHDYIAAVGYAQRACEYGSATACLNLGFMHLNGIGTAVDGELARQAFSLACAQNLGAGCGQEGRLYTLGDLIPLNNGNAVNAYRAGCGMNDAYSCNMLAWHTHNELGTTFDAGVVISNYQRGCAGGIAIACDNLELIRSTGPA